VPALPVNSAQVMAVRWLTQHNHEIEIGIRMALGAAPSQVARAVLTRTALLLIVGVSVGFAMAFAGGEFFSQILYGIGAHDLLTYLCAFALMAVVAFIACWVPARRAIKIDPLTALRTE
jgi:putative ABC transport system permease protein